jgi:ankyrin repeat protein
MGKLGTAGVLLEANCKSNLSNHDGCIPIHVAAEKGWVEMVLLLLEHGADVNRSNVFGWVALHFAASKGNADILKILLDFGASTQFKNRHGQTAFELSAAKGFINCANLLQDKEISVNNSFSSPAPSLSPSPVKLQLYSRPEVPLCKTSQRIC